MYIYPCGIVDRDSDWVFQGVVVAANVSDAKKEVVKFKKENELVGESVVDGQMRCETKRKKGVYTDTNLG